MNGILNINKPAGITSHDVVYKVRKLLNIKKVGHTGTLDPFATGVLVVCVGKSTRIIRFLPSDKEYIGKIKLGEITDTYDRTGEIISTGDWQSVGSHKIIEAVQNFTGEIEQIPPMYSAIKINGKKLYELARKGKKIKVEPRQVTIHKIEVISIDLPFLEIKVHCSAGTYIRSIAYDVGQNLGCGGHLFSLVRTRACGFSLESSMDLSSLTPDNIAHYFTSPNEALQNLSPIHLTDEEILGIRNGVPISNVDRCEKKWVRLLTPDGYLVAIGEIQDDIIQPIRVFV